MIDPNLMVNTVKRRKVALGQPRIPLPGGCQAVERKVCVLCKWSEASFKVFDSSKELIITLGLLDYLLSFHHYASDLWAFPILCRLSSGPTYQLVCLEKSQQAFLQGEKWNWEETWPFWSPHGVGEWDLADCFRNMGQNFAENLVMRNKDCCSLLSNMACRLKGKGKALLSWRNVYLTIRPAIQSSLQNLIPKLWVCL